MRTSESDAVMIAREQDNRQVRRTPLYMLFSANTISSTGSALTQIAIPWFVLQTTGSITLTGITAFFSTLPVIISALLGGTIIDKFGFKWASIFSDIVSGICVVLVPLLTDTFGLAFWQLLVLVFLAGLFRTPGRTARSALFPDLAHLARMRLERANSISEGVVSIASFIGTPLAAFLIALLGTRNLLWIDAASYFVSAFLIGLFIPAMAGKARLQETDNKQTYLHQLNEGIYFIVRDPVLLIIVSTVIVTNLLNQALNAVIIPAYVQQTYHNPLPLGWIFGAFAGAALVGTFLFGIFGHRLPPRLTFGISFIINGAARFWILLIPLLPLLVVTYAIAGLANAPLNPIIDTFMQKRVPLAMRARVFGTVTAGAYLGIPLGSVLAGFLVTWIGMSTSLIIMGAIFLAITLSLLINPALRKMDE